MKQITKQLISVILVITLLSALCPMTFAYSQVGNGSSGQDVRTMQTMLNTVMKAGLSVDGICGPKSVAAIKSFQSAYGLSADGICGKNTWAKLEEAYNNINKRCTSHSKGSYLWPETAHPHYQYYKCANCGETFTDGSTTSMSSCATCNPPKKAETQTQQATSTHATIRNGSQGQDVRTLQTMLNAVMNAGLSVDGICGAKTVAAVKNFQKAYALSVDGVCGKNTWAKLEEVYHNGDKIPHIDTPVISGSTTLANDIVAKAESLINQYPYVWGGESPSEGGFDCTGLVYYVYSTCCGVNMTLSQARSKSALLAMGTKITNKNDFKPGDIVQFNYAHVAIFVGNNMIVEASSSKQIIRKRSIANDNDVAYAVRLSEVSQEQKRKCTNHTKGSYLWPETAHPHYQYYKCAACGETFTDGSTTSMSSCKTCNPPKKMCSSHRFNSANGNNCINCDYIYTPLFTTVNKTYQAARDDVAVRNNYYAKSGNIVKHMKKDERVRIVSSFRNSVGNLWYKTSDGNYIFSDNLVEAQSATAYGDTGIVTFSKASDGGIYLTKNFKVSEFACKDGSDEIPIDMKLVDWLQQIRDHFGASVTITSGYRSPSHNKKIGGASNSYHLYGRAADIVVAGHTPKEVAQYAASIGVRGIELNAPYGYVHIDTRDSKYWFVPTWSNGKIIGYNAVSNFN